MKIVTINMVADRGKCGLSLAKKIIKLCLDKKMIEPVGHNLWTSV